MNWQQRWQEEKKELFTFLPVDKINLHDKLLAKSFLKLLPNWVTPNQISIFRLLTTPLVFWLTYKENYIV